jgi:hypothetical protein
VERDRQRRPRPARVKTTTGPLFRRQKPRLKLPQAISAKSKIGGVRENALPRAREKRRRRLFAHQLEQPNHLAGLVDIDGVGRRHLRQARHGHDVAADHDNELGAGGEPDFADVHDVI